MLPQAFLDRVKRQLGDTEYTAFLAALERPRAAALRMNPLKRPTRMPDFVTEQVPWEPNGYYFDPGARPGLHPWHEAGVYYLQEASAMAPVVLLDPQPGETICDLCAAPGGKSTQIAGRMAGRGLLIANEISRTRAQILSRNIERLGIANAVVTNEAPAVMAERFPAFFDRVLVDAPCSGEGMFRKEEAAVTDWSPETVAMCAERQAEILDCAAMVVRPGGRLVYSTCTFSPEENEETVEAFLARHPEFAPEEVSAPWFRKGENGSWRLWPHLLRGEGHFAAVLQKGEDGDTELPAVCKSEKVPKEWTAFARELGIEIPDGPTVLFGDTMFRVPENTPDLKGLRVLRPGLELGTVRKGRMEPAHALALWLRNCEKCRDYSPDSPDLRKYLSGNVLPGTERGWCLITAGGCSLGWAKGDGAQLKNHYPKGLRRTDSGSN